MHCYHPTHREALEGRAPVAAALYPREGNLVFDLFCSSGATGVVAKELNRFFSLGLS